MSLLRTLSMAASVFVVLRMVGSAWTLLLDIGSIIRTIPVGPMEAWKIAFSGDVREFVYPIDL